MPRFDVAAVDVAISLFAGVFHDSYVRLEGPGFRNGPGSCIGFGIIHGIRVLRMAVVDSPECVDEARLIAERMSYRVDPHVAIEVSRFNDHRVSLPVAHRI